MEVVTQALRGALGVAVLLAIGFAMCGNRKAIVWRPIAAGIAIQVALAFLILKVGWVRVAFDWVAGKFVLLLGFSLEGSRFLFDHLADKEQVGVIFAFQILPVIIFFSALTSLLYYLGILQWVVYGFGWVMSRLMRLSGAESLAAAANIFVGQTEAPLVVKPYIEKMTRSELMALMVGGFATIAGSVLAAYVGMLAGADEDAQRDFARFLLCASVMNAPASLAVAKLIVPQVEEVERNVIVSREKIGSNLLDAISGGTTQGLHLALNVGAMLLVFLALIALCNAVLSWMGMVPWPGGTLNSAIASVTGGKFETLSLQAILGFLFAPLAFVIGIESGDLMLVGQLLGEKMILTEFVAYASLGELREAGALSARSIFIATFALCGFANFASIGIQLGGIGTLAPNQRPMLASLAVRAMLGGTIACLLSASIAGIFYAG